MFTVYAHLKRDQFRYCN